MTEEKEAKGIAAQYLKDGIKINTSIPDRKKVQFDTF